MTPDQLREIMEYLRGRVALGEPEDGEVTIRFDAPTAEAMIEAGLDADGCRQIVESPWWDEMGTDVVETPDMCYPEDPPEQVLEYAKDVVTEYIRKRAEL